MAHSSPHVSFACLQMPDALSELILVFFRERPRRNWAIVLAFEIRSVRREHQHLRWLWRDSLCVRYACSGCSCAILNQAMSNVLAPIHSYIPIHAPVRNSRASTGPFTTLKMHLIAYVAARDCTYASLHMAGRRRTSTGSQGAHDGSSSASRRHLSNALLNAWQGQRVCDRCRSHRSLLLQPQPWRGHCRFRAMVVASRRGGQPSEVRGSTLTHP